MYPQAAIEAATTVVDTLDAADAIQVIAFDKSTIGPAFFIARVVQAYSKAPCLPTRDLNMCNVLQVIDLRTSNTMCRKLFYSGFETGDVFWPQHPRCWDQNTSQIQILRHFEKKGREIRF